MRDCRETLKTEVKVELKPKSLTTVDALQILMAIKMYFIFYIN